MRDALVGVWPPLPPHVYARRPSRQLPFPLEEPNCAVFARARHGLWQGVQALGLLPGDEVLAPAYHHGSEIEALGRAGLVTRFYETGETLEPDAAALESLVGPKVRALYLTHYLGFPQDVLRWREWCDERSLLLLEDAAQAWLASSNGSPIGSVGDLAIFCLYKTVGVPDGGALIVRARVPQPESIRTFGFRLLARRHALWLMQRSERLSRSRMRLRQKARYVPEIDFALGDPGSPATSATFFLLPRVAPEEAASRRRANYAVLLEELGDGTPRPFETLACGAVPFGFPVESERKHSLLERLRERGIAPLDLWSVPHGSLPQGRFPDAAARRARTVVLPVHQELRPTDLERIVEAARDRPRTRHGRRCG